MTRMHGGREVVKLAGRSGQSTANERGAAAGARARRPPAGPSRLVGFVLRVLGLWATAALVIVLVPGVELWIIHATVASLAVLLPAVVPGVGLMGNEFHLGTASIQIVSDCTTLMPSALLIGAIVAYPARVVPKLAGLFAGLLLLWGFNAVRILVLLLVLVRYPAAFDLVHIYVWQTLTIAVVAAVFAVWVREVDRRAAP